MTETPNRVVTRGRPWPLGVTTDDRGANVAVWADDATQVLFCLFDEGAVEERIDLARGEGGVWHAHIAGITSGDRYGFRADGPNRPEAGLRFNPQKLLLDPYAQGLDGRLRWHPRMSGYTSGPEETPAIDARDSAPVVPKCVVPAAASGPDPTTNRPHHSYDDLVIYEAHLKGLSAAHPGIPEELRGTYAGFTHPAIIRHLTGLGVNAVELLPVQAFLDDRHLVAKGLRNYWGYQPICWLSPEPRYAYRDADAEMRKLVHDLHEAGIEVILDVVFNHSGEGDELGPTLSLRGLNNAGYYRLTEGGRHYVNDTGTGNTLAADRPMVLRLVLDALRHWATRYGVDGFRFDLAATLGRTEAGFDAHSAFFQAVRQDPVLAGVKLIAEPWDIGPGGYQLGEFPAPWREWNDRFRDGVRRSWRGDALGEANLGACLLGSSALFEDDERPATTSINFITAHDGFTLADTVSYAHKHNEANGESNRDGHDDNISDNLGVEGPSGDPGIVTARGRRSRAMLATLLLSQGVPMLLAGDEIGNSQGGNNNAYAQDNEIGWVDWSAPDTGLRDLVAAMIELRRRMPLLRQTAFLHGRTRDDDQRDVVWRLANGESPTQEDWHDPACQAISVELRGAAQTEAGESTSGAVLIVLNTGGDAEVQLPPAAAGSDGWRLELDTAKPEASYSSSGVYPTLAQAVVVFSAE